MYTIVGIKIQHIFLLKLSHEYYLNVCINQLVIEKRWKRFYILILISEQFVNNLRTIFRNIVHDTINLNT